MVLLSSTSLQLGLAIATTAFAAAGPIGALWVRSVVGAALLALYIRPKRPIADASPARRRRRLRARRSPGCPDSPTSPCDHAPLGDRQCGDHARSVGGVGLGPARDPGCRARRRGAIGVAILSLAHGTSGEVEPLGIAFAFAAAASFAAYIVAGKKVGKLLPGLGGLALALLIAAAIQTPLGLAFARPGKWAPDVLVALAAAGVLATLMPFALEMTALRSLSMATFGLLLAFETGVASPAGIVVRGRSPRWPQVVGIALVIAAAAGSLGPRGWMRRMGAYNRA